MKGQRGVGGVPLPPTWSCDLRRGWFRWHAPLLCGEGGEALQEGLAIFKMAALEQKENEVGSIFWIQVGWVQACALQPLLRPHEAAAPAEDLWTGNIID